jgi:hypothetical protein
MDFPMSMEVVVVAVHTTIAVEWEEHLEEEEARVIQTPV